MKRVGKPVFFIVAILIIAFTATSFTGIKWQYGDITKTVLKGADDIRWGIDIRGGVDVTFSPPDGYDATNEEMDSAASIIRLRLLAQNITDHELYTDMAKDRIIVRFPWKSDEADFNPEKAIKELGETAMLTFREGVNRDLQTGLPTGEMPEVIVLEGKDIESATAGLDSAYDGGPADQPTVQLTLKKSGTDKFSEATGRMRGQVISIWMDETLISYPTVNDQIRDGKARITGNFTPEEAKDLADKINAGALPFKLQTENYSTISPTLGMGAKDAMVLAGALAFLAVSLFMIFYYRLPGFVAVIALTGQVGLMVATITGYFGPFPSFTLTLPGIAGIILSIGFGVDANVISSERIKEEIRSGKTIDGALNNGYERASTAIFDGNITVIIVAVVLMGAFGPPGSALSRILTPVFFLFGPATEGTIYSFGYTLLMGVLANFVMGVWATQFMVKSISKFKPFRKAWLYGGTK